MDLFPTMVAATGAELPGGLKLDGVNLLPLLQAQESLPKRTLFWRHNKAWAVRKGSWKLCGRGSDTRLYNLTDDIGEKRNLADAEPQMVRGLRAEFLAWEQDVTAGAKRVRR
jgi:arylsulfatase A-like enzyme